MDAEFLDVDGGRISYEDTHTEGPLVVLMPPMGALRSVYRFLIPTLAGAGYRVVSTDLRGHGDTTTDWKDYSIAAHGRDIFKLIRTLNAGPAFLIGNSFTGGVGVWTAVETPDLVRGIVLMGAFVRKVKVNPVMNALMWVLFVGPWGPTAWMSYYPKLYPTRRPDDFIQHVAETKRNMKEPGRFQAFKKIAAASKDDSEKRLKLVKVPALVIMGSEDPDFPDAAAEASFQAEVLHAEKVMIEGAGHHPQADSPDEVGKILIKFMKRNRRS